MMEIKGIKCDNESCDYDNEDVEFDDYQQWLNKPCPKCGANLLTEADLNTVQTMMELMNSPLIAKLNGLFPDSEIKNFKGNMNGTGKIDFEETDD